MKIHLSIKRIGLTENYQIKSIRQAVSVVCDGKNHRVGQTISEKDIDNIIKSGKVTVTIRG